LGYFLVGEVERTSAGNTLQGTSGPSERDLMFVLGSLIGLAPGERETGFFVRGYGAIEIDPVRLAYYDADWAIQDLVGYAERVLVADFGPASRPEALRIFMSSFDPGGEVDVVLR
jgi:spectinomycin phosphotransferase